MDSIKARKVVQNAVNSINPTLTEGRNTFTLDGGIEVVVNVPRPAVVEDNPEDWWESSEEYWDDSGC